MGSAVLIDGKAVAKRSRIEVKQRAARLAALHVTPGLAAVLVGDDPASEAYVANKARTAARLKINSQVIRRPSTISQDELIDLVIALNRDESVHGILVQSPLPSHIDELAVTLAIDPTKDVDGFHPYNMGMLLIGRPVFEPCTPLGVMKMLEAYEVPTVGCHAVVVGRSTIVGKPLAAMLARRGIDATVTLAHSRSADLGAFCRTADLLIAAVGRPGLITAPMVKPGATVIDVGINRITDPTTESGQRLVGDVDFDSVSEVAGHLTPVPGGVGPMTVAMLMHNTVVAAERLSGI